MFLCVYFIDYKLEVVGSKLDEETEDDDMWPWGRGVVRM